MYLSLRCLRKSALSLQILICFLYMIRRTLFIFFFFQAEDGIRDYKVTGVQTCALPISGAAIISAALTAQYVILAISILFFVLAKFLRVPWKIHEYRLVLGFGISSLEIGRASCRERV